MDGSQVLSITSNEGDAGNITIDATESVNISRGERGGSNIFGGFISTADRDPQGGDGGNVHITTPSLTLEPPPSDQLRNLCFVLSREGRAELGSLAHGTALRGMQ